MIKNIAWNVFKSTGDVNVFLEMKKIEEIQNKLTNIQRMETDGNYQNEGNNNCRK